MTEPAQETLQPAPSEFVEGRGMYRRIAHNSALLASGTAASSLFMMLAVALAARSLSTRDFGVLVLLQSAALMAGALASFSTQQPVIKLGSDAQAEGDRARLGTVISMAVFIDLIAAAIAFVAALIAIEFSRVAIGLADQDVGSAWIIAVSLIFTGYPVSNGIFRLYNKFGLLSIVQTVAAAGLLAAYVVLHFAHASLETFVWVWAVYLASSSMAQLWFSLALVHRDRVPLRLRLASFKSPDGRTLIHYCWTTWGTSTAETLRTNGDSLLVGAIVSVEAAGLYTVARQLAGIIRKFNVVYKSTVFPEIARLGARHDGKGAARLNRRMLWAGFAAAAAGVGLSALFGHLIIRLLFGARFSGAYLPFVVMTAAAIAQLISITPSMCVQIFRGPRILLALHLAATAVFAMGAVVLTYAFSITGMALSQLMFAVILGLLCNVALSRTFKGRTTNAPVKADAL